jgi:hypothetical protein
MMSDLIVACVRTGLKFPFTYVERLRNMVARHMSLPYLFVCLTDQKERCDSTMFIDVREIGLVGWWAKMILFEPRWRSTSQIIYLDLDTVIIGDLAPLADVPDEFAILESPVRALGHTSYPCKYNSSVMVIGSGRCTFVWDQFDRHRSRYMLECDRYGDQLAIETIYGSDAAILNKRMPAGFFCNYRELTMIEPKASVINFGGPNKPHNCPIHWVQREWR